MLKQFGMLAVALSTVAAVGLAKAPANAGVIALSNADFVETTIFNNAHTYSFLIELGQARANA